jgi:lantibiotic modifying enzyme
VGTSRWLEGALRAAAWIRSSRIEAPSGCRWRVTPRADDTALDLYHGAAGVVLFLLEMARATGDGASLEAAGEGARQLARSLPDELGCGLYDGLAGVGFALLATARATGDAELLEAAEGVVARIEGSAQPAGGGVEWDGTTDILSGAAGNALFLLGAARELGSESARAIALRAGARIVEVAEPAAGGVRWRPAPGDQRLMPNFAHGTAGVAFALARLAAEGGGSDLAAAAGARSLISAADTAGGGFRVLHHEPGGHNLHYLSWCHGPAGTVRLFAQLALTTGDSGWLEWVERGARSVRQSGAPERTSPGHWGNLGRCCGAAGIGELFLDLYRAFGRAEDLAFARRVGDHLLARAVPAGEGLSWPHAEHRLRPDEVLPQTGLMQGAAGVGLFLLRLDAAERGRGWPLRLPDEPDWGAVGARYGSDALHGETLPVSNPSTNTTSSDGTSSSRSR